MKAHYFISQLRHFGFSEKLNQSFYDHSVCEKKNAVFIKPKKYDYTCISPFNFFSLKKKYNIKKEYITSRMCLKLRYKNDPDSLLLDYEEFENIKGIDDEEDKT